MGWSRRRDYWFIGWLLIGLLSYQFALGQKAEESIMDSPVDSVVSTTSNLPKDKATYVDQDSIYFKQDVKVKPIVQKNWEKAKDGLDYSRKSKKEKPKKKEENAHQRSIPIFGDWVKYILFAVILLGFIFLIYKIVMANMFAPNKKVERSDIELLEDIEENLRESDLEKALRLALANKDYRLAIRIYYLSIIKELNSRQWITWKRDKTNYEYIREMGSRKMTPMFMQLTLVFERAWYGDQTVTESDYNEVSVTFKQFIDQLKNAPNNE